MVIWWNRGSSFFFPLNKFLIYLAPNFSVFSSFLQKARMLMYAIISSTFGNTASVHYQLSFGLIFFSSATQTYILAPTVTQGKLLPNKQNIWMCSCWDSAWNMCSALALMLCIWVSSRMLFKKSLFPIIMKVFCFPYRAHLLLDHKFVYKEIIWQWRNMN